MDFKYAPREPPALSPSVFIRVDRSVQCEKYRILSLSGIMRAREKSALDISA
jgi:hypothetical protein